MQPAVRCPPDHVRPALGAGSHGNRGAVTATANAVGPSRSNPGFVLTEHHEPKRSQRPGTHTTAKDSHQQKIYTPTVRVKKKQRDGAPARAGSGCGHVPGGGRRRRGRRGLPATWRPARCAIGGHRPLPQPLGVDRVRAWHAAAARVASSHVLARRHMLPHARVQARAPPDARVPACTHASAWTATATPAL